MFLYIKNRLQVLDILYQYHRCCLILEWQIHSPVWKISYPLNTGFLPSTELQSSKKLPTTSSLHNPTKLQKVRKKKTKTPNESTRNIHPEPSFRTTSLRVPASLFPPRDHFVLSFVKAAIANQDPQGEVAQPGGCIPEEANEFPNKNLTNKKIAVAFFVPCLWLIFYPIH